MLHIRTGLGDHDVMDTSLKLPLYRAIVLAGLGGHNVMDESLGKCGRPALFVALAFLEAGSIRDLAGKAWD